jgi:hypothetical protein
MRENPLEMKEASGAEVRRWLRNVFTLGVKG